MYPESGSDGLTFGEVINRKQVHGFVGKATSIWLMAILQRRMGPDMFDSQHFIVARDKCT